MGEGGSGDGRGREWGWEREGVGMGEGGSGDGRGKEGGNGERDKETRGNFRRREGRKRGRESEEMEEKGS